MARLSIRCIRSDVYVPQEENNFAYPGQLTEARPIKVKSGVARGVVTVFCQGSAGTITTSEFEAGVI